MSVFSSNVTNITLDDETVAYRTNLIYGSTKFCIDASYHRDYPKYNLGILSVDASIKDSYTKELSFHCEGPGLDYYKTKFASDYILLNYFIKRGNTFLSLIIYPLVMMMIYRKSKKFLKNQYAMINRI